MKSARKAAREVYAVRQMVSDPGAAVQCQVTISAVKAYMGGFPEFTVDVRAVGRNLARVAAQAEAVYRERFESVRLFMAEQKGKQADLELLGRLEKAAKEKAAKETTP